MNKCLYPLLLVCLIVSGCSIFKKADTPLPDRDYIFPLDWIGAYEGELLIFNQVNDTLRARMQLIIDYPNADGYYPWTLIYNDDDIRAYGLEAVNPASGHYRIDEFNSIKLDAFYKAGHFISKFDVLESDLLIDYCRVEQGIEVQLYIFDKEALNRTGGEKIGADEVPEVETYALLAFQKALLVKKEKSQ